MSMNQPYEQPYSGTYSPTASLAYRRAATQQASTVGLVIALHDTLIGNLGRAADAMDRNDIQTRCDQLVHGFKVLQHLDAMLDMDNGGETAVNVRRFYAHVRGQMLQAQFKLEPATLRDQVRIVMEVRGAWQQLDSAAAESGTPQSAPATDYAAGADAGPRTPFSCNG